MLGEFLRALEGADYLNPDEITRKIVDSVPGISETEANSRAWAYGRDELECAINERRQHVFETTLGGNTITNLLLRAANEGIPVRIAYIGLENVELHIARVAERVRHGGHDIPELRIRERYNSSRENLVRLIPQLCELRLWDNSVHFGRGADARPCPRSIFHLRNHKLIQRPDLESVPEWAKPIVAVVLRRSGSVANEIP